MEVTVLASESDVADYENGIPNNLLCIAFTGHGVALFTGLEMNLSVTFADAREHLKSIGDYKAKRRIDRYMKRYSKNRFVWN